MQYTFFHVNPDNTVPSFDLMFCSGEAEARARTAAIFKERMRCGLIEVRDERGNVFVVERQAA